MRLFLLHGLMPRFCVAWLAVCALSGPLLHAQESPVKEKETVVLVHGMGRTRASMLVLKRRFEGAGYATVNFPYSQADQSLDEITGRFVEFIRARVKTSRYHIVGHSLGNVIARQAFKKGYPPGLGRIVMLAPPNHPAHLAKKLKDYLLYRWLTGDSGQKLSEDEFYKGLPVPQAEFGVIAGDKGGTFREPNDGIVTLESTKLDGMKDFIVLHRLHTFIMNSPETFELSRSFLETGRFKPRE